MFVYHVNSHLLSEQQLISYYLICLFHFYGTCESGLTYFRYLLYLLYIKRDVVFLSISSTCACWHYLTTITSFFSIYLQMSCLSNSFLLYTVGRIGVNLSRQSQKTVFCNWCICWRPVQGICQYLIHSGGGEFCRVWEGYERSEQLVVYHASFRRGLPSGLALSGAVCSTCKWPAMPFSFSHAGAANKLDVACC